MFDGKLIIIDRQNFPVLEKCKNLDGHRPKNQNYLKLAVVLGQKYNATVIIILYIVSLFCWNSKKRVNQMFKRTFHKLTDELLVSNTGMDTEMTRPTPCQSKTTNNWNAANESLNEAQHKLTTNSMHLLSTSTFPTQGVQQSWCLFLYFNFLLMGMNASVSPPLLNLHTVTLLHVMHLSLKF